MHSCSIKRIVHKWLFNKTSKRRVLLKAFGHQNVFEITVFKLSFKCILILKQTISKSQIYARILSIQK